MDLRHINAFVAVAEEGSVTKAAHRLHISQPPLTRQIRELEIELGVVLFVRHARGVELTNEGQLLLENARATAQAATLMREAARTLRDDSPCVVRVGIAPGLWNVAERIRSHHVDRLPQARVAMSHLHARANFDERSELDVVITRVSIGGSKQRSAFLFDEQLVAVISSSHALASRDTVKLVDLAVDLVHVWPQGTAAIPHDRASSSKGVTELHPPASYLTTRSPFTDPHCPRGARVIPIDEPDARVEVRIEWPKRDPTAGALEFLRSARAQFPLEREAFSREAGKVATLIACRPAPNRSPDARCAATSRLQQAPSRL